MKSCAKLRQHMALAASFLALLAASSATGAGEERVWTLGGLEDKNADSIYLGYGVPESDDSFGSFTCKPGSGDVKIWVAETSAKLKPGKGAAAILSVGATKAKVAGKLMPNEEAGVPSFEGTIKASEPIIQALATGATLEVVVGPSKQSAPLGGAADKFKKFAAACSKH